MPMTLHLILERLRTGYYRQWAAVPDDVSLMLAKHDGTALASLARSMAPALLAACSEDDTTRKGWQRLHAEVVESGEVARALAVRSRHRPPPRLRLPAVA